MSAVSIQPLPPGATATFKVISPAKQEQDCFISQLGVSKIGASLQGKAESCDSNRRHLEGQALQQGHHTKRLGDSCEGSVKQQRLA